MPFRPDIEGLRALAVLFVLIWHAGVPWLPGGFIGVDVFFVVSGFLMTSILHREQIASRRGMVNVGEFYARRARRLVPASLLTLIATAIATFVILPETRWRDIGFDIAAAGGYLVNWRLADRAVDYLQQDAAASPIQHFWSLSVEEQFYVFWPLLLVGIAVLVRLIRFSITKATFAGLALIAVASLAWSSYLTDAEPGRAYFVTTTRLWELAIGGLVALALPSLAKLPMSIAAAFAWIGLASIVGTGFLLTTTVPFPGMVALIPTVGAALVIASGPAAGPYGPIRMCTNRLVLWIGGCSYSIYLWHWPFIVIGGYWVTEGLRETSVTEGVGLALLSVLPAWLSLRFVENPLRRSEELIESVRKSLTLAFLGIAVSLVAGLLLASLTPRPAPTNYISKYVPPPGVEKEPFGAEVLGDNPVESPAALVGAIDVISPSPQAAPDDNPAIYLDGCHLSFEETEPRFCDYGDLSSSVEVAVVGDSHAAQWLPALQSVALDRAWKLKVSTKSSCPYLGIAVLSNTGRPYDECVVWNQRVTEYLTGQARPAGLVLSYGSYPVRTRDVVPAAVNQLKPIAAQGTPIVVLRDTPVQNTSLPECVAGHRDDLLACATPRDQALGERDRSQPEVVASVPGASLIDLTDWICPSERCAAVIGGVIVYRDEQHMTATYSRSLATKLESQLERFLPKN